MDVTSLPETISPITEPGTKLSRWVLTRPSLQVRFACKHALGSLGPLSHIPVSYDKIPISSISYPQAVLVATSTYLLTINFSVSCFAHTSRHAYTRQLASVNHQLSCPLLRTNDTLEYAVLAILRSISRKLG